MNTYDHLVRIDEAKRELRIFRVEPDGRTSFFTSVQLPDSSGFDDALSDFARQLGENLLLDSPAARRLLGL